MDNIVRDWDKLQGMTSYTDGHIQRLRDINTRLITIENSGLEGVDVALVPYASRPVPKKQFHLKPGQVKSLGINPANDMPIQFIWVLDPKTGDVLGEPAPVRHLSNQFVIRNGLNTIFIQPFYRPSISAAK